MKKYIFALLLIATGIFIVGQLNYWGKTQNVSLSKQDYITTMKQDLFSLMMAYPEDLVDIGAVDQSQVYLVTKSGKKLLYDDLRKKTAEEKLQNPDLQDMMEDRYILGPVNTLMSKEYNPGRIRFYPLLKEVYGGSQGEIEKNLTGVAFASGYHRFNQKNAAAFHLKKAIGELHQQAKVNHKIWGFIQPIGGTYNYRYIAKTNRLSPHSFGISIDLTIHKSDYWQWATRAEGEKRLRSYPSDLVDIMENNYFIWGGKWGYFDILHFEYRPEIIMKGKFFAEAGKTLWYERLPVQDEQINNTVLLIEERLRSLTYN